MKTDDTPGVSVIAAPIIPPVQDSAHARVSPREPRMSRSSVTSEGGTGITLEDGRDAPHAVYLVYDASRGLWHEMPPLLTLEDPPPDLGARIATPVVHGGIADLVPRLLEEPAGHRVVGVDPAERRAHRLHVGDPHRVSVQILDGDDAVVVYPSLPEGLVDHEVALPGREWIGRVVGVLRAADAHDEPLGLGRALHEDLHMSVVERLEPPDDEGVPGVAVPGHSCRLAPIYKGTMHTTHVGDSDGRAVRLSGKG